MQNFLLFLNFVTAVNFTAVTKGNFIVIGSYWEAKKGKEQNEIDIVALKLEKNRAVAVEVKRQRKEFNPAIFAEKVQHLKDKLLPHYDIDQICLTLEDM